MRGRRAAARRHNGLKRHSRASQDVMAAKCGANTNPIHRDILGASHRPTCADYARKGRLLPRVAKRVKGISRRC